MEQLISPHLGVSPESFKNRLRNPNNYEVIMAVEHNDLWGAESKIFATCVQ